MQRSAHSLHSCLAVLEFGVVLGCSSNENLTPQPSSGDSGFGVGTEAPLQSEVQPTAATTNVTSSVESSTSATASSSSGVLTTIGATVESSVTPSIAPSSTGPTPSATSNVGTAGPVDCSAIEAAGFEVCVATLDRCGVVFTNGAGCAEVCSSAGLRCAAAYENLEDECGPDEERGTIACDSGHESDYCLCESDGTESSGGDTFEPISTSNGTSSQPTLAPSSSATGATSTNAPTSEAEPSGDAPCTVPDYIFNEPLPVGWATEGGGTTGGGNAAPQLVTSLSELQSAVSGTTPKVIYVQGDLAAGKVSFGSNKTLIGCSSGAHVHGSLAIGSGASNIIVRNLQISGYAVGDCTLDPGFDSNEGCSSGSDAVGINGTAHHVWFDHCSVKDGTDGNLDVTNNADFVTISWTKFSYTPRTDNVGNDSTGASGHRYSNLVGGTDTAPDGWPGTVPLNVTWHHNWWADNVVERQPRVRYGRNHLFNNYYNSNTSNYCVRAGIEASVLLEGNYFDGVDTPHEFNNDSDQDSAFIALGSGEFANVYDGTSGEQATGGGGQSFEPPYDFMVEAVADVPALVMAGAGPH